MSERVAITEEMFPLFVLLPDEGMIRIDATPGDVGWHEAFDLEDAVTWAWTNDGRRFRLRHDGEHWLEPASCNEIELFAIIARHCVSWRDLHESHARYHGDYSVLRRWLKRNHL